MIIHKQTTNKRIITKLLQNIIFALSLLLIPVEGVIACSLQFTLPQRGITVFTPTINVAGTGSGTANSGAVGSVSATINGFVFFQQSGTFTSLINFFGSGSAIVSLKEGINHLRVNGSVEGCSASDSMVIYYEPQLNVSDKNQGPADCSVGNPINTATGNKYQVEIDYRGNNLIPSFQHSYNSDSATLDFGIGYGWTSIISKRLVNDGNTMLVHYDSGKSESFVKLGGIWQGDADSNLIIREDSTGFIVETPQNQVERYDKQGRLVSDTDRFNLTTHYSYGSLGLINSITGPFGHTIQLSYSTDGHLDVMTDPQGNDYTYSYDNVGNLLSVTYPDNTPLDNSDNPTRVYHYENLAFPHHLTGITDETGIRYATWAYDTSGRAVSSEHAGGLDKSTLIFNTDGSVTTTNPLGKATTFRFTTIHGVKKVTDVSGHATASCVGANQAYTYDINGYLASKTDWQGNVTTYVHDTRGLEISRTEAAGTPQARTITTDWHVTFRLPVKVIKPGQITDYIYDTQGRLISQTTRTIL